MTLLAFCFYNTFFAKLFFPSLTAALLQSNTFPISFSNTISSTTISSRLLTSHGLHWSLVLVYLFIPISYYDLADHIFFSNTKNTFVISPSITSDSYPQTSKFEILLSSHASSVCNSSPLRFILVDNFRLFISLLACLWFWSRKLSMSRDYESKLSSLQSLHTFILTGWSYRVCFIMIMATIINFRFLISPHVQR